MQETATETPTAAPRKKGGRPRRLAKLREKKEPTRTVTVSHPDGYLVDIEVPDQSTKLAEGQLLRTDGRQRRTIPDGYSGKCKEVMIYSKEGESGNVFLRPAMLAPLWCRRQYKLILPDEYIEALNSANSSTGVMSDWDNPREDWSIPLIEVPLIRFPFQIFGEKTWDEYCDFRDAQRTKPTNPAKR